MNRERAVAQHHPLPRRPPNKRNKRSTTTAKKQAPELLLGHAHYGYAVDLWGVGCVLAGLLFKREPFFRGVDDRCVYLRFMCI